jgi:hypothetical protein
MAAIVTKMTTIVKKSTMKMRRKQRVRSQALGSAVTRPVLLKTGGG